MQCCSVLKALLVIFGICNTGITVKIDVIDGLLGEGVFECNNPITFKCQVTANSPVVQWAVGDPIAQDVICFGSVCSNSSKYPGRYLYAYDPPAGISNLKIANATFDDDRMKFQCSDQSSSALYNASTIKAPPKFDTTLVQVTAMPNLVTATLTTGCIYPVGDINLVWYSTLVDGKDLKIHPNVNKTLHCSPIPNCKQANTSVESSIEIYTTNGQERDFSVNISFGSVHFSKSVGKYTVIATSTSAVPSSTTSSTSIVSTKTADTTTISRTSPAFSLSSSSPENNTTSSSSESSITTAIKSENIHKQTTDDSSTILIAAFSSMAGLIVLVIAVFVIKTLRKRHNRQPNATNMRVMNTAVNLKS